MVENVIMNFALDEFSMSGLRLSESLPAGQISEIVETGVR